jgi:hypothetical protein
VLSSILSSSNSPSRYSWVACVGIPDIDVSEDRCAFIDASIVLQYYDEDDPFLSNFASDLEVYLSDALFPAVQDASPTGSRIEMYSVEVDADALDGTPSSGGNTTEPTAQNMTTAPQPSPAPSSLETNIPTVSNAPTLIPTVRSPTESDSGFTIPGFGGPTGTDAPTVFSTDLSSFEFSTTEFPVPTRSPTPAPNQPTGGGSGFVIPGAGTNSPTELSSEINTEEASETATEAVTEETTETSTEEFSTTEVPGSSPTSPPEEGPTGGDSPSGGGDSGFTIPLGVSLEHHNIFDHKSPRRYLRARVLN